MVDLDDPFVRRYLALQRVADWVCQHGHTIGYVVRPWCGSPACPACRAAGPDHWAAVMSVELPTIRYDPAASHAGYLAASAELARLKAERGRGDLDWPPP